MITANFAVRRSTLIRDRKLARAYKRRRHLTLASEFEYFLRTNRLNARLKMDVENKNPEVQEEVEDDQEDVTVEQGEANATNSSAPAAKKKKKKAKKKKAGASVANGGVGIPAIVSTAHNAVSTLPDEEFAAYCADILKKTEVADLPPPEQRLEMPEKFKYFNFTGSLRPAYVSNQVKCPPHIATPDYAITGQSISEQLADRKGTIPVNSPAEIAKIRHACAIGREVLDIAGRYLRAGVTGDEIDRIVHHAILERNGYPSPLNYYEFPKSVCVSVNEIICHGIPDFRPVQDGDIVNIDISVYIDGFHTDLNETYMIGEVDEESKKLVKTAYLALQAACAMIKPGTFYRDVGNEISRVAHKNGCAVVKKYGGHGVGKLFHGTPNIPHYAKNKAIGIMRPGHVFTIEPMLNLGSDWGTHLWPDNWTESTRDGKRSSQFEHTFLVTETGCEILTAHPSESRTEMVWNEALEARLTRPGSKQI